MKQISAIRIMKECFDSLKEYNQITESQAYFIMRILDDCFYGSRKIQQKTIEHFMECYPDIFEKDKEDATS